MILSYPLPWPLTMHVYRTFFLLPLTVFAILLTSLAHADFQDGKDAYGRGDYETALKEWQSLGGGPVMQFVWHHRRAFA